MNATERHARIMFDLFYKAAEKTPDDEGDMVEGGSPIEDPPEVEERQARNASSAPYSDAVMSEIKDSRTRLLSNLFARKAEAEKSEQAAISNLLEHGDSQKHESRAPLLESGSSDPFSKSASSQAAAEATFAYDILRG